MRLFVPLTRDEFDRLLARARAERRRPQDEAALLIVRSLDPAAPQRDAMPADIGDRATRGRAAASAEAVR
jgi:hypothetical protein